MVDFKKLSEEAGPDWPKKERVAKVEAMDNPSFATELENQRDHMAIPGYGPTYEWSIYILYLPEAIKRLKDEGTIDLVRDMLPFLQACFGKTSINSPIATCIRCVQTQPNHTPDCSLAAIIKRAEEMLKQ